MHELNKDNYNNTFFNFVFQFELRPHYTFKNL
jgi:hypothetical protein